MRRLLFALLLVGVLVGQALAQKAYNGTQLKITSTWVNPKQLREIRAESERFHFLLVCNADSDFCGAPLIGEIYVLYNSRRAKEYSCDEYGMGRDANADLTVCLENVSAK
jgi:hypothetical protein